MFPLTSMLASSRDCDCWVLLQKIHYIVLILSEFEFGIFLRPLPGDSGFFCDRLKCDDAFPRLVSTIFRKYSCVH